MSERTFEMAEQKKTIYRDSKTGQITTEKDAKRHPDTTEKERVRIKGPKK